MKTLLPLASWRAVRGARSALNRTTQHWYTQAASCEIASGEVSATRSAWTAAVTSGV